MLNIHAQIDNPQAADFCSRFLAAAPAVRYVLGRNEYAVSIANAIEIAGFIDDFTSETVFLGKPIFKMADVPKGSMVVSSVIFVVPLTALNNLHNHGLTCLDYFSFKHYSGLEIKAIDFIESARMHILDNIDEYISLYDRFADNLSKNIFEKFVHFRLSSDIKHLNGFVNDQEWQYFEDFLKFKSGDVFVDAGGFDGQTVINFIEKCPKYRSVHFFEPEPANISIARSRLSAFQNINYYNHGLGDTQGVLRFSSGGGSASAINDDGDIEIRVDTIDNVINEPVSIIKMDIEGSEIPALRGAKKHIEQDHPVLIICCYHKYDDLLNIPAEVYAIRNDYSLYLRHYTEGLHESVMFFIPNERT